MNETSTKRDSREKKRSISVLGLIRNASKFDSRFVELTDAVMSGGLRVGSLIKYWADISKTNYYTSQPIDMSTLQLSSFHQRGMGNKDTSVEGFVPSSLRNKSEEDNYTEEFPDHVTSLMNADRLWGCFYNFPELYSNIYSPVVRIRDIEDVPELVGGVLTRDMVTACLTYLKRTPILGDFVYIKLDLSSKHLKNIEVLQHYKYLVYLDLSSNLLTELNVLSNLLYLQFLSVAFNRLNTVLEYDTPQWFLTEVLYKYNSVKRIRDLSAFWSITILDLSHNNIKGISGLETLRYLRRLDLSFNHIQRLENLNNLRLLWLDVSYNNISSFEYGPQAGLWTLLHLEYLNLNENTLTTMKVFSGCTRLRELHARNNRLSMLLELAVYMRQMRRLIILDLRANPICSTPGYKDVVISTFPLLLSLDAQELDPVDQRTSKMNMTPDVTTFATRRLLRLLYVEQLSKARVHPTLPPADTTEVSLVVLVGYEALGKGTLARRLSRECKKHVEIAKQHTTAQYHSPGHYIEVSRSKFDDMLLAGEFLTYTEMDGREEAFIKEGKVKVACMDLVSALMLKLRGRQPYLILVSCLDVPSLKRKQTQRKMWRDIANLQRLSMEAPLERSTLQVLLSGRIIITGILNEIILCLPEEKEQSEFVIESECSLMLDSQTRAMKDQTREAHLLTLLASSVSLEESCRPGHYKNSHDNMEPSLYSVYKDSQGTGEDNSYVNEKNSYEEHKSKRSTELTPKPKTDKPSSISQPKSVDFSRYASSTWKGLSILPDGSKSSKSVTFTSTEAENQERDQGDPIGLLIDEKATGEGFEDKRMVRSISTRMHWPPGPGGSLEDLDLWLTFLIETGIMQTSDPAYQFSENPLHIETGLDDLTSMIRLIERYHRRSAPDTHSTNVRDEYENIHRLCPGLFWDTIMTDNMEEALTKLKRLIKDIVNSQKNNKPMFDIDFARNDPIQYAILQRRVDKFCKQIAPYRLFY